MTQNKVSLHGGSGGLCTVLDQQGADTGNTALNGNNPALECALVTGNNGVDNPVGCGIDAGTTNTFGSNFNNVRGGYYITQWTSTFIKVWFFPRNNRPPTLDCDVPDVSTLGPPMAWFAGSCDFANRYRNQRLIFTTNFCGSWAGADNVYDQNYANGLCTDYGLATDDLNCVKYVAENPAAFTNQ